MTIEEIDNQIEEIKEKMSDPNLCDGTSQVFQRISGYFRAIEYWNSGKAQEMRERKMYTI